MIYPFRGLIFRWQVCDVCVTVLGWYLHLRASRQQSLSEVRTSVAELNLTMRRWSLSEVRTSVEKLN